MRRALPVSRRTRAGARQASSRAANATDCAWRSRLSGPSRSATACARWCTAPARAPGPSSSPCRVWHPGACSSSKTQAGRAPVGDCSGAVQCLTVKATPSRCRYASTARHSTHTLGSAAACHPDDVQGGQVYSVSAAIESAKTAALAGATLASARASRSPVDTRVLAVSSARRHTRDGECRQRARGRRGVTDSVVSSRLAHGHATLAAHLRVRPWGMPHLCLAARCELQGVCSASLPDTRPCACVVSSLCLTRARLAVGDPPPLDYSQTTNTYGAHAAGRLLAGGVRGWLRPNPARSACALLAGAAHPGARPHRLYVPCARLSRARTTRQRWAGWSRWQSPILLCADWAALWQASER